MRSIFNLFLVFLSMIAVSLIYFNSTKYLKETTWKYGGGGHSGDVINIDNSENYKEIYISEKHTGKVVLCVYQTLYVRSVTSGEIGTYYLKPGLSDLSD